MMYFRNITLAVVAFFGSLLVGNKDGCAETLRYFAPGNILPTGIAGIQRRQVVFPDWVFPMQVGASTGLHAYIGTQLSQYHGLPWSNDPRLFAYPHRDNQCEPRRWRVDGCPSGKGHQGVDIRANDNRDNHWEVVAVEDGVVTSVTSNTTVAIRNGNHTVRYLHMHPQAITLADIRPGVRVRKGQVIGRVSCFMESTCSTSRHLHFDAYTGTAGQGMFYHVYPSLVAAYRRAWSLPDGVNNGELAADGNLEVGQNQPVVADLCAGVSLSSPISPVASGSIDSFWLHNCSKMRLEKVANSDTIRLVYHQPKSSLAALVSQDPVLFEGVNRAGRVVGKAAQYSSRCNVQRFDVEGRFVQSGDDAQIEFVGRREKRDASCNVIGEVEERLVFDFIEKANPQQIVQNHTIPSDRTTLSEVTRNFLAVTFYPDDRGVITVLPYFKAFPGYSPENGRHDSAGGLIPALGTDEAGVGISWVWIKKRAQHTQGTTITPRTVAHSMAGVNPAACTDGMAASGLGEEAARMVVVASGGEAADGANSARTACNRVLEYLRGYIGFSGGRNFASEYFGRQIAADDSLDLTNADVRWNWMRTMYSHESGRAPVVSREAFERGVILAEDFIAEFYDGGTGVLRDLDHYSDPCAFNQPSCTATSIETTNPTLTSAVADLALVRQKLIEVEETLKRIDATNNANVLEGPVVRIGAVP